MIASTITIPVLGQPHLLEAALTSLIENSFYKHRIIVIMSEEPPDEHHTGGARDWKIVDGRCLKTYESVADLRAKRGAWLDVHGVEFVDVTEEAREFHARTRAVRVVDGGVDVAFKNNAGLKLTDTEWTIPNWDCDFFAGLHWDRPLVDYARLLAPSDKVSLVPMHVQPRLFDALPVWSDPWESSRAVASNVLGMPTTRVVHARSEADTCPYVTADEFYAFCIRMARPGVQIHEKPGERSRAHWVPAMLRTRDVVDAGAYALIGCGYDLEFDNRLGDCGFRKVGFCDSFQLHKGYPPVA